MGKESVTLSMELAKTQCYEFECFEDSDYQHTGMSVLKYQRNIVFSEL